MTFVFGDVTVTTWGERDGEQRWRARRSATEVVEFYAPRDTLVVDLHTLALLAFALAAP